MNTTQKTKMASYCPPRILQTVRVMLEVDLLAASDLRVRATGQEVDVVQDAQDWTDLSD